MPRFNVKTVPFKEQKTLNLASGEAFKEPSKIEFASLVLCSFVQDQFYRTDDEARSRLRELMNKIPPLFAAKTAVYARDKFGMRSISHVIAGEIANTVKGQKWTKEFFSRIVVRPDDMTEIISYYDTLNPAIDREKHPHGVIVPNAMKKGFAQALRRFTPYQLAKYRGKGNKFKLVDVVNFSHPRPVSEEQEEVFKALVNGTLKTTETWESKLSLAGQQGETEEEVSELKAEAWKQLLQERKIGYFALLRNLRNIVEQAPELVTDAASLLTEEEAIRRSRVLPFRYLSAMKSLEAYGDRPEGRVLLSAIETATDIALANTPLFEGKTLIVLDVSGSMLLTRISAHSDIYPADIGALFAASLLKRNNADMMVFAGKASTVTWYPASTLRLYRDMRKEMKGGGTNLRAVFEECQGTYDRIIILSDMQHWIGLESAYKSFKDYCQRTKSHPLVYSFDLQGYGTLQMPYEKLYCLEGWSEKVFDVMKLLESDKDALIHEIEAISLGKEQTCH